MNACVFAASLLLVATTTFAIPILEQIPPKHHQLTSAYSYAKYRSHFNKTYTSADDYAVHEAVFKTTLSKILTHNADSSNTWKMGVNKFTDMTPEERSLFKGRKPSASENDEIALAELHSRMLPVSKLPKTVDWRTKGVVTPVKNQGGCGSCWAFSATEVIESAVAIQTGQLLELSPQQMVSCAPNPNDCGGTGGCQGSVQWLGFNYTQVAGGLSLETQYPYKGVTGTCEKSNIKPAASVKGYVRLPANNYTALMNAVATIGPIAISVDASWMDYETGVYKGDCGTTIDHAVVLVGYGTDKTGGDFYLVRNSWGTTWGDKGYIKLARHSDDSQECGIDKNPASGTECKPYPKKQKVCGACGILSDSSYPTGGFVVKH